MAGRGIRLEANILRFKFYSCGDQNVYLNACHGGLDGKMAEMADRAGVWRSGDMMMPDHPERSTHQ